MDAAAATRSCSCRTVTVSAEGVSDSSTSTVPPSDFDRIMKPESRKTASMAVFSASVVA
jgi:hypothetical protein